jgi:7-cyano-7-deazaguanine synthase in queuosine biosynthesis
VDRPLTFLPTPPVIDQGGFTVTNKRPLLLFSGGLDSTTMLYAALQESDVDVLFCDCGQHAQKIQAERLARRNIIRWMNEERVVESGKERFHVVHEFNYSGVNFASAPSMRSTQSVPWLVAALYHCDPCCHSEVRIGYVMGDDALIYRHEIQEAWRNLCLFSKTDAVPLEFPLLHYRKEQLLKWLPADLLDLIWVCETPKWRGMEIVACGHCKPCERHNREMKSAFGTTVQFKKFVKQAKEANRQWRERRDQEIIAENIKKEEHGEKVRDEIVEDAPILTAPNAGDSSVECAPALAG